MTTKSEHSERLDKEIRIVLTSENSAPIKKALKEISREVMMKNTELYRRLGNK